MYDLEQLRTLYTIETYTVYSSVCLQAGPLRMPASHSDEDAHTTNDPEPPGPQASDVSFEEYRRDINNYAQEWCDRYNGLKALSAPML